MPPWRPHRPPPRTCPDLLHKSSSNSTAPVFQPSPKAEGVFCAGPAPRSRRTASALARLGGLPARRFLTCPQRVSSVALLRTDAGVTTPHRS